MQVLVELWKARPRWLEWSADEQAAFLERAAPAIRQLLADGVELVSIGAAGTTSGNRPDYDYWAIWRFAEPESLLRFTETILSIGWHDLFDRVNVEVEGRSVVELLADHTALG